MKTVFVILLLALTACNSSKKDEPRAEKEVSGIISDSQSGDIHGTSIGDDIDYVMAQIRPHIVSEMPDEITARIPLNIKDSTFYDIDYDFRDGKLYSIDLDIYPKSLTDCMLLFSEFKSYYDSIYGSSQSDEGYTVWYTKADNGDDVEISMMDESKTHNKPYLAISFYQEDGIAD